MSEEERLAALQAEVISDVFSLTTGEDMVKRQAEQLTLDTHKALATTEHAATHLRVFGLDPETAFCPAGNKHLLAQLPPLLAQRWTEWEGEYQRLAARNPKLALHDMLSWISETHVFSSWLTGWEDRIRDWVDADSLTPMPFEDRLEIIKPEFYARLRKLRAECRGWLRCDGGTVRFVPDAE